MGVLVSVIIPVYQVRAYLAACLESVLAQDYPHLEILLIDDCSSDGSLQLAEDFAARDARIRVIRNPRNLGLGAARNVGLAQARGKYVLFLDSDDSIAKSDAISYLVALMEDKELELLCFSYYLTRYDKHEKSLVWRNRYVHPNLGHKYLSVFAGRDAVEAFYWNAFFAVWMRMYSREFLQKHQLRFVEGLHYEDVPFTVQALSFASRVMISNRCLINYRLRNESANNSSITQNSYNRDIVQVFQMSYDFLCTQSVYNPKLGYAFLWCLYLNAIITMAGIKGDFLGEYYRELRTLCQRIAKDYPFLPFIASAIVPRNFASYHRRDLLFLMQPAYRAILQYENPLDYVQEMMQKSLEQLENLSTTNPFTIKRVLIPLLQSLMPGVELAREPLWRRLYLYPYLFMRLFSLTMRKIFYIIAGR